MIERAGVDVDSRHLFAPGAADRFGKQPAAVALAGKLRDQADERQLAFARLAVIELEQPHFAPVFADHREQLDRRIVDDRGELVVVQDQAREP